MMSNEDCLFISINTVLVEHQFSCFLLYLYTPVNNTQILNVDCHGAAPSIPDSNTAYPSSIPV